MTLSTQFVSKKVDQKTIVKLITVISLVSITKVIQKSKFNNLDIIIGGEYLNKSSTLINMLFENKDRYLISDAIYSINKDVLEAYNYVLIDYPPLIQELALNFLILSDLVIIPINSGAGGFKGLVDLKNTLNQLHRQKNRRSTTTRTTSFIFNWLKVETLNKFLSNNIIKNSDVFIKTENDLARICDNKHYWCQKQAYEQLIKEGNYINIINIFKKYL